MCFFNFCFQIPSLVYLPRNCTPTHAAGNVPPSTAFLTPDAVKVLVEKYNLMPADTSNPDLDLAKMMARA
jgi:hypothetical protein